MEPITDPKELFQVELWLVELKTQFECEAQVQPPDVAGVYLARARQIGDFLVKRLQD